MQTDAIDREPRMGMVRLAFTVLAPFACGYFLSYLFRAVNAVVAPDLVRDVGLSASELGLLTAAYLIAFALFQLPLGMLLDRFGPRRVQTALLCCAAAGGLLFAIADDVVTLTFARALIGLGFAGGLMAGFKAVVLWLPKERMALANACVMSFGALGLVVATQPTDMLVQVVGWRAMFVIIAAVTVAVAALIFAVVPERPGTGTVDSVREQLAGVGKVFRDRFFWRMAPLITLTAGSHIAIQTLWAGPWFRDVAGLPRDGVADALLVVAVAFLVGTLLAGIVADLLGRIGVDLLTVMLGGLFLYLLAEAAIVLELLAFSPVAWFVFGMTGQIGILAYPRLSQHFGAALSGRANTAMNLLIFATAFGCQYVSGAIIDLWPGTADGGYDTRGYQVAFGTFLGLQLLALIWYFLPRR
ncbi:MAG: MFS transporter [Minwuiales bacterium]|nr:MFS transporter [Minwuiales bacterium]